MIKYFYLAGGYGRRARPLSLIKPKSLFPLLGIPLIFWILDQLKEKGMGEGFINLHHLADDLTQELAGISNLEKIYEKHLTGSRILSAAAPRLGIDPLLVINGDIYLKIPLEEMVAHFVKTGSDGVLLVRNDDESKYSSLAVKGDRYLGLEAGAGAQPLMYTGVALFKKEVVAEMREMSLFSTLQRCTFDIRVLRYDGIWLDLGTPRFYFQANKLFCEHATQSASGERSINLSAWREAGNILSQNVSISPESLVTGSIIWENTRILGGSVVTNSIVTKGITIGDGRIENKILTPEGTFEF